MKKIFIILFMCMMSVTFADADPTSNVVDVYVDGVIMDTYDYEQGIDMPAFIYNSRTMLPLKRTFSLFGISSDQIVWDEATQTVYVRTNAYELITFKINDPLITKDGEEFISDVAPMVFNNRTYVPVAIISKLLGEVPVWDQESFSVIMNPSIYYLDNLTWTLPRALGFTNPEASNEGYFIGYLNQQTGETEKSLKINFEKSSFETYFDAYLISEHLDSEDFKILNEENYTRYKGRNTWVTLGYVGAISYQLNSIGMTENEILQIIEGLGETNEKN